MQIVVFVALVYLHDTQTTEHLTAIDIVMVLVLFASAISFYISLGLLAKRLGRSWIVWVGLTIITKPIGMFVAYFMMNQKVTEALASRNEIE